MPPADAPSKAPPLTSVLIGLAIAALLVAWLITWYNTERPDRYSRNETHAIGSMVLLLQAQVTFHKTDHYGLGKSVYANQRDGCGFPDLYRIGGPGSAGERLELISEELANARWGAPNAKPHEG